MDADRHAPVDGIGIRGGDAGDPWDRTAPAEAPAEHAGAYLLAATSEPEMVTAPDPSPGGRVLASGSRYADTGIRVWDSATGGFLVRFDGHTGCLCGPVLANEGRGFVSAAADPTVRSWNTKTWATTQLVRGHSDEVRALSASEAWIDLWPRNSNALWVYSTSTLAWDADVDTEYLRRIFTE